LEERSSLSGQLSKCAPEESAKTHMNCHHQEHPGVLQLPWEEVSTPKKGRCPIQEENVTTANCEGCGIASLCWNKVRPAKPLSVSKHAKTPQPCQDCQLLIWKCGQLATNEVALCSFTLIDLVVHSGGIFFQVLICQAPGVEHHCGGEPLWQQGHHSHWWQLWLVGPKLAEL